MSSVIEADTSEDIADFLLRIRELGEKRDQEDEERTRELEADILQGRKERQARRERARSMSPTKSSSHAGTPYSTHSPLNLPTQDDITRSTLDLGQLAVNPNVRVDGSPSVSSVSLIPDDLELGASPQSLRQIPSKISGSSNVASSTALKSKRMGTLSWQQRHPSGGFTKARSSTLSAVSTDNCATQGTNTNNSFLVEEPLSRNQIAKSLLLKDPTWFRQTEDRGFGSVGYRRNKYENGFEAIISNGRTRFSGLSRDTSLEPKNHSDPSEPIRSASPLMDASVLNEPNGTNRHSSFTPWSSGGIALSPLPILSCQILQPMLSDSGSYLGEERSAITRTPAMSPSQGRISPERPERPHSPTKGLGGFVQSAMLKRSDSVNKRWSTQAATGLIRGNSVVNSRNGNESSGQAISGPGTSKIFKPNSPSRQNSPLPTSRPGSSNNASTATVPLPRTEKNASNTGSLLTSYHIEPNFGNEPVKSGLPPLKATPSLIEDQDGSSAEFPNKPVSPSKRWSPTKASWLEKALNKPESPKPRIVPPQQPSWMMDITKAKQQRGSVDLGRSGASKEVMDRSLARSASPGIQIQPHSDEAPPSAFISRVATKNREQILNKIDSARNVEQLAAVENFVQDAALDGDAMAMNHTTEIKNQAKRDGSPSRPISFQLSTAEEGIPSSERGLLPSPKQDTPPPSTTSIDVIQARNRLVSASDMKSKPKTPPKKDFRSVLKTRPISDGRQNREEPEFKNVFGKLKRTETQNYVAPDELKENILRGKAGLAATGGPKKPERRDELRESILRQKEAMKIGAPPGIPKKPRDISVLQDRDSPPPEAITKRLGLTKSESGSTNASTNTQDEVERFSMAKPGGRAEVQPLRVKLKPTALEKLQTTNNTQIVLPANSKPGDQSSSSLAGLLKRGPSSLMSIVKPDSSRNPISLIGNTISADSADEHSTSSHSLTHITKSRAKGPKRRLPQSAKLGTMKIEITSNTIQNEEPGAPEMTQNPTPEEASPSFLAFNTLETQPLPSISSLNQRPSQLPSQRRLSAETSLVKVRLTPPKARPEVQESRSVQIRTPIPAKPMPTSNPRSEQMINQPISESAHRKLVSPATDLFRRAPITICEKDLPLESPQKGNFAKLAKRETYELKKSPSPILSSATSARSPVISSSRKDDKISLREKGLNSSGGQVEPVGLGIQTGINDSTIKVPPESSLPSPTIGSLNSKKLPRSPPLPGKKPGSIANRVPSIARPIQERKPPQICQIRERSQILASFFEVSSSLKPKFAVDTQAVLASRPKDDCPDKIKTLRKQIYLMTGGGKLMTVSSHQEHILFEENLYLCIHVFATAGGSRTAEVYLWIGDGVAQPAAEDAHLFARKVAREQNGKLITLQQGNETSNFFQALGGIVITRRGPGSRAESPSRTMATYMLCGRSHAGQIAFDEVDFDARSLCSGFPFLISARFGKLYLWKGLGSSADELGCARLIGMDLGLTGEIEEVDEGSEPGTFWESLPGGKPRCIPIAEDGVPHHWHLKPSCDKYSTRLFCVDVEPARPKSSSSSFIWGRRGSTPQLESTDFNVQIRELFPFTQRDIGKDGVYVLDSFFEIFLIFPILRPTLSESNSHPSTTLRASLLFAEEYAILSASTEDRPFVPNCQVVFMPALSDDDNERTVPDGMRWCFRKWNDRIGSRKFSVFGASDVGKALRV